MDPGSERQRKNREGTPKSLGTAFGTEDGPMEAARKGREPWVLT
jgi:hypothetical protein